MCIICIGIDNNKLTPWEASRNRAEMLPVLDEDHLEELDKKITAALYEYLDSLNCHKCTKNKDFCKC